MCMQAQECAEKTTTNFQFHLPCDSPWNWYKQGEQHGSYQYHSTKLEKDLA